MAKNRERYGEAEELFQVNGSLALAPQYYEGNAVPSYQPEYEPEYEPQQQPQPEKKKRVRVFADSVRFQNKLGFVAMCSMLVLGLVLLVSMYSINYAKKGQLAGAKKRLNEAQQITEKMIKTSSADYTVDELYDYAKIELGMVTPKTTNLITITLEPGSYTSDNIELGSVTESRVTFHWFNNK